MVHIQWLSYIITLWWAMVIHNHYSCQVFSWSQKTIFQDFRGWQNKTNKNVHIFFTPQKKMPRSVLIYGIWWYNYIPVCIIIYSILSHIFPGSNLSICSSSGYRHVSPMCFTNCSILLSWSHATIAGARRMGQNRPSSAAVLCHWLIHLSRDSRGWS